MNTLKKGYSITDEETQNQFKLLNKTSLFETFYSIILCYSLIVISALSSWYVFNQFGINIFTVAFYLFAIFIIAARQRGLENLIHEAQHLNFSRNYIVNDAIAWSMLALPLGRNINTERYQHIQLHHNNFWTDVDPDLKRYQSVGLDKLPADSYKSLVKLLFRAFPSYVLGAIPEFFLPKAEKKSFMLLRYLYWIFIISMFYFFGYIQHLALYWYVPFFFTLFLIRYIAEITEHASLGCENEFASSRNNLGWFNEWIIQPCGSGYHMLHHIFPKIPWYNLPKAHRLLLKDKTYAEGNHYDSFFFSKNSTIASLLKEKQLETETETEKKIETEKEE